MNYDIRKRNNMPTIRVNDIDMYYEIQGEGEPVVLIAGLNSDHTLYQKLGIIPRLAQSYQVVAFDNRGVGQTDKPDIPYSIEMMADDTAGLLHTLALALQHPELVKSLILVSTIVKSLKGTSMTWSRLRVNLMLKIPMIRGPHPYYAAARQLEASRTYDCMDRLNEIHVPTLILHGKQDKSAPYRLAEAMHSGIKGSQMITFQGGHLFFIVRQKQFMKAIADFLDSSKLHMDRSQTE